MDELPEGAMDAMVVVRNYHDVEWVFDGLKRKEVVASILQGDEAGRRGRHHRGGDRQGGVGR